MEKTLEQRYTELESITQKAKENVNKLEATLEVQQEAYETRKAELNEAGIQYDSLQELKALYDTHKGNLENLLSEMENQAGIN